MQEGSLEAYLFYREDRACREHARLTPGAALEIPCDDDATGEPGRPVRLHAIDGTPLAASLFLPSSSHGGLPTVVIASATGVRRAYYAPFAAWLAARGFAVVTFDYRGIGDSREPGTSSATMSDWGERDLAGVVHWASEALAQGPVHLVGHSVGGQLVGLLPRASRLASVVTVASQSGDYRLWPSPSRYRLALLWHALVPGVAGTLGYLPGSLGIGEDLPGGVALEWARWCRTPGYMIGADGEGRRAGFERLTAPVLGLGFEDDDYAPPAAVDALLALYANAPVTRRHVPCAEARVGHFGFFRARFERTLWAEVEGFMARKANLPGAPGVSRRG